MLDEWAQHADEHGERGPWLSQFLTEHCQKLPEALHAADFLNCFGFLQQGTDALLLFLTSVNEEVLAALADGKRPHRSHQLAVDFSTLPYLPEEEQPPSAQGANHKPASHAATHAVTPAQYEALVQGIVQSGMLPKSVTAQDVSASLLRIGFRLKLVESHANTVMVGGASSVRYLTLDVPQDVLQVFSLAAINVSATAHDQGASRHTQDHGTYNNAKTFADVEVVPLVVGPDGLPTRPHVGEAAGGDAAPALLHKEERVWTNLHAVGEWQRHRRVFKADSELVKKINAAGAAAMAATAAQTSKPARAGSAPVSRRTSHDLTSALQSAPSAKPSALFRHTSSQEAPEVAAGAQLAASRSSRAMGSVWGWRLSLYVVAEDYGWRHHISVAQLEAEFVPRGSCCSSGGGSGGSNGGGGSARM